MARKNTETASEEHLSFSKGWVSIFTRMGQNASKAWAIASHGLGSIRQQKFETYPKGKVLLIHRGSADRVIEPRIRLVSVRQLL